MKKKLWIFLTLAGTVLLHPELKALECPMTHHELRKLDEHQTLDCFYKKYESSMKLFQHSEEVFVRDFKRKLGDAQIVLVSGIFTGLYEGISDWLYSTKLPSPKGPLISFQDQKEWFDRHGIPYVEAPISTQASMAQNASIISHLIGESQRPLFFVTHSKGALDVLEALVRHPEFWPRIRGWVAIQPPFQGTPLADMLLEHKVSNTLLKLLMPALGGSVQALHDMTPLFIEEYKAHNSHAIYELTQRLPIISVGGHYNFPRFPMDLLMPLSRRSFMQYFGRKMEKEGYKNDGLVPTRSSQLPHTPFMVIEDMDHSMPVMGLSPFAHWELPQRILFTSSMIQMLLP